jgi:hypothetical protein
MFLSSLLLRISNRGREGIRKVVGVKHQIHSRGPARPLRLGSTRKDPVPIARIRSYVGSTAAVAYILRQRIRR